MTIDELKEHCKRAISPENKLAFDTNSKIYQEHKLILDIIEELENLKIELEELRMQTSDEHNMLIDTISEIKLGAYDEVEKAIYRQCFEYDNDEDMQKWDSGNWIRYKLFENVMEKLKKRCR